MGVFTTEWKDRIDHWTDRLSKDLYRPVGEIKLKAGTTMEQLSAQEGRRLAQNPVEPGFTWGSQWEYCWFKGNIELDESVRGRRIVMDLKPEGESTIFVNGKEFGTYRADWVKIPHHYIEDNTLVMSAQGGEHFEVLMETYAGHDGAMHTDAGCSPGPVLFTEEQPECIEGKRRTLGRCTYGIWYEEAYQLYMDIMTLSGLLETIDEDSLRASKIADALEKFTLIVDFEQEREKRLEDYVKASEYLKEVMSAENGSTVPVFYAIGNAHIDLAWLWPMAETYRKTCRTFAAQLRLLEEYPDYKYIQSQPAAYEMCRKYYPELFERIKEAIKEGRWIAEGAMWVEPDTNVAGGEALIRQIVHGKRYYKEMFGIDSEVLWLPDTFGYSAVLPQILSKTGVKYLVTQKIFWSYNKGEQFPYHYFTWTGLDGSSVTSFLPTSYTFRTDPKTINMTWKNRVQKRNLDAYLLPFGYGDGGGGPSRDYLEYADRQKNLEGGAAVRMESPNTFFHDMEKEGKPANNYTGELYFSAHRGTYTSQAKTKWYNRKCELALRELEMWGSLAMWQGEKYPLSEADSLWKEVLLNQFHDILPGSSIARVYEEAEKRLGDVLEKTKELISMERAALAGDGKNSKTVWNSLPFERTALITVGAEYADGAETLEGEKIQTCKKDDGSVLMLIKLPSCGAVTIVPSENALNEKKVWAYEENGNIILENSIVKAVINSKGQVISYVNKSSAREFAAAPLNTLHLYKDVPRKYDAWDIDSNYTVQEVEDAVHMQAQILYDADLEAAVRVTGTIGNSSIVQDIRLASESTRIEFSTKVEWKEMHRMLKAAFPIDVLAEYGSNEIQFGYMRRPAHRSRQYDKDRFEVCNHRYSALYDESHGAAVLNDSKYGISMNENTLELTLLRAAVCPAMRADNGIQEFTYAFCGWEGSFTQSGVVKQGYELNVPAEVTAGSIPAFSAFACNKDNVIIETVKPAEDGSSDLVLRIYESQKAAVSAVISCAAKGFKAYNCDMLENVLEEIPVENGNIKLDFKAFEIKTIRLSR